MPVLFHWLLSFASALGTKRFCSKILFWKSKTLCWEVGHSDSSRNTEEWDSRSSVSYGSALTQGIGKKRTTSLWLRFLWISSAILFPNTSTQQIQPAFANSFRIFSQALQHKKKEKKVDTNLSSYLQASLITTYLSDCFTKWWR